MKKFVGPLVALLGCGAFSAVLAQSVEGLDLEAIEKRAESKLEEAQELFDFAIANAEQHQEAATEVVDNGFQAAQTVDVSHIAGPDGAIDLDEMLAGSQQAMSAPKGAPLFIAFASLSMPEDALARMIADTTRAGGVIVFRGFSAGNPQDFVTGIQKVVDQQGASNVAIDPRLFRAFSVDRVPTYVALSRDFEPCDQLECTSQTPPHDKLSGNVSAEYALTLFAEKGGPGASVSTVALKNLKRGG